MLLLCFYSGVGQLTVYSALSPTQSLNLDYALYKSNPGAYYQNHPAVKPSDVYMYSLSNVVPDVRRLISSYLFGDDLLNLAYASVDSCVSIFESFLNRAGVHYETNGLQNKEKLLYLRQTLSGLKENFDKGNPKAFLFYLQNFPGIDDEDLARAVFKIVKRIQNNDKFSLLVSDSENIFYKSIDQVTDNFPDEMKVVAKDCFELQQLIDHNLILLKLSELRIKMVLTDKHVPIAKALEFLNALKNFSLPFQPGKVTVFIEGEDHKRKQQNLCDWAIALLHFQQYIRRYASYLLAENCAIASLYSPAIRSTLQNGQLEILLSNDLEGRPIERLRVDSLCLSLCKIGYGKVFTSQVDLVDLEIRVRLGFQRVITSLTSKPQSVNKVFELRILELQARKTQGNGPLGARFIEDCCHLLEQMKSPLFLKNSTVVSQRVQVYELLSYERINYTQYLQELLCELQALRAFDVNETIGIWKLLGFQIVHLHSHVQEFVLRKACFTVDVNKVLKSICNAWEIF